MILKIILLVAISYFLGAIPTGYILAKRLRGIDIRKYGSGNPGAANVYRIVGKGAGWATFFIDAFKGFLAVMLAQHFMPDYAWFSIFCGFIAIFAHMSNFLLKFKGGKGVATSAGVFAALLPLPTLIAFTIFIICVAISGHISVGSVIAALIFPFLSFFVGNYPLSFKIMGVIIAVLIIYKHIPNMQRLLKKEELKFEDGSDKDHKRHENK